ERKEQEKRQAGREQETGRERDVHGEHEARNGETGRVEPDNRQEWWEVLEVAPQVRMDDLKRAYRRKVQLYHPDRLSGLAPELLRIAERRTRQLNLAFEQAKRSVR